MAPTVSDQNPEDPEKGESTMSISISESESVSAISISLEFGFESSEEIVFVHHDDDDDDDDDDNDDIDIDAIYDDMDDDIDDDMDDDIDIDIDDEEETIGFKNSSNTSSNHYTEAIRAAEDDGEYKDMTKNSKTATSKTAAEPLSVTTATATTTTITIVTPTTETRRIHLRSASILMHYIDSSTFRLATNRDGNYYDDNHDDRKSHLCCGSCCDLVRACILVNAMDICISTTILLVFVALSDYAEMAFFDTLAVDSADDSKKDVDVYLGMTSTGILFAILGMLGASKFQSSLVLCNALWRCVYLIWSATCGRYLHMVVVGFFLYPHVFLYQALRKGTICVDTYAETEQYCCCQNTTKLFFCGRRGCGGSCDDSDNDGSDNNSRFSSSSSINVF